MNALEVHRSSFDQPRLPPIPFKENQNVKRSHPEGASATEGSLVFLREILSAAAD